MKELHQYYTARITSLAVLLALAIVFVNTTLKPRFEKTAEGLAWLTPTELDIALELVPVALLALGVYTVQKHAWKLERPEFNFSGDWQGVSTFTEVRLGDAHVPFTATYEVRVHQDCLSIRIEPSTGESFINWGSLALDLPDKDTIRYAYWVSYSDLAKFPSHAIGYEEVRVTARDETSRPVELTGTFHHCAQGQTPVYSGTIKFVRHRT